MKTVRSVVIKDLLEMFKATSDIDTKLKIAKILLTPTGNPYDTLDPVDSAEEEPSELEGRVEKFLKEEKEKEVAAARAIEAEG